MESETSVIGGHLTLVILVLTALPTYWISLYRLPKWVIKELDHIRRDFLWFGPDIDHPSCRLVRWKNICRSRDQGGWGILDLDNFNQALLGKWWWKFATNTNWIGSKVILFNYGGPSWNMFPRQSGRISFFWKGVSRCLPPLRGCISFDINSGKETLFWKDNWLNGWAPRLVWPDIYFATHQQNGSVWDLRLLLSEPPFSVEP